MFKPKIRRTRVVDFLIVGCCTLVASSVSAGSFAAEQQLKKHLFPPSFDPLVRPVEDNSENVTIHVDISLIHLVDLYWNDPQLRWNPSDYGNISMIHVGFSDVWTPDIVIYNEVGLEAGIQPRDFVIAVQHNGSCLWLFPRNIESSCKMEVSDFPYDVQICNFIFGSWALSGQLLDLKNKSARGITSFYVDNGEWSLVDIEVERNLVKYPSCEHVYPDVTFKVVLQRRSLYYVYNIIAPCIVITMLHLTAFLLPAESGEKISLNVTILLGLTVFLLLVAEIMPPQSLVIPIVGQYFGICVLVVSLSTTASVFILHLHFRGSRGFPLPRWVRSLIIGKLGYVLGYGSLIARTVKSQNEAKGWKKPLSTETTQVELVSVKDNQEPPNDSTSNGHETPTPPENGETEARAISSVCRTDNSVLHTERKPPIENLGVLHMHVENKMDEEKAIIQDWILVSLILDRLFFILFSVIDIMAVLFVLCRVQNY